MADWATFEKIAKATGLEPKKIWKILTAKDLQVRIERRREDGQRMEFRHKPAQHPRCERVTDDDGDVWIASRLGAERIGCGLSTLLRYEQGCRYLKGGQKLKYWEPPHQFGHYHRETDIDKIALHFKNGISTAQLEILGTTQKDGYLKAIKFAEERAPEGRLQLWCEFLRCRREETVLVSLKAFRSRKKPTKSCGCLRAEQAPANAKYIGCRTGRPGANPTSPSYSTSMITLAVTAPFSVSVIVIFW